MKKLSPERERFLRVTGVILSAGMGCLLSAAGFRGVRLPLSTALAAAITPVNGIAVLAGSIFTYALNGVLVKQPVLVCMLVLAVLLRWILGNSSSPRGAALTGGLAALLSAGIFAAAGLLRGGSLFTCILNVLTTPLLSYCIAAVMHCASRGVPVRVTRTDALPCAVCLVIVLAAVIVALNSFVVVEAGHTGVVVTMGAVNEGVLQEGIHLKAPFVQDVVKIDNRIQKLEVNTEAFSKDLQSVKTVLAINYRVDTSKSYSIYKNIGADYENVLVVPAVNEVLKAITATYTAEESVTNRALISDGLVEGLNKKLNDIGLYVTDVNIIDFDFSEAFITAIEEKQVAQQQLLKAETEKLILESTSKFIGNIKITNAQADAEAVKIKADAEASANETISKSLTDNIIENKKIEKWNGELPRVEGGSGTIIDIGGVEKGSAN